MCVCVYSGSSLLASHQIYGNLAQTTGYVIVAAPSLDRSPDRKWNNKNNKIQTFEFQVLRCTFQTLPVLTWLLLNIYISAGNHSALHFLLWMCDFRRHGYSDWPHQAVGPQCSHTGDESGWWTLLSFFLSSSVSLFPSLSPLIFPLLNLLPTFIFPSSSFSFSSIALHRYFLTVYPFLLLFRPINLILPSPVLTTYLSILHISSPT